MALPDLLADALAQSIREFLAKHLELTAEEARDLALSVDLDAVADGARSWKDIGVRVVAGFTIGRSGQTELPTSGEEPGEEP